MTLASALRGFLRETGCRISKKWKSAEHPSVKWTPLLSICPWTCVNVEEMTRAPRLQVGRGGAEAGVDDGRSGGSRGNPPVVRADPRQTWPEVKNPASSSQTSDSVSFSFQPVLVLMPWNPVGFGEDVDDASLQFLVFPSLSARSLSTLVPWYYMAWLFHGLPFSHVWRFLVVCGSWRLRLLWAPFVSTLVSVRLRPWKGPAGSLSPVAAEGPSWPSSAPCASRLRTALPLSPARRWPWPEKLEEAVPQLITPTAAPGPLQSLDQLAAGFLGPREYVHVYSSLPSAWRLCFFLFHPSNSSCFCSTGNSLSGGLSWRSSG